MKKIIIIILSILFFSCESVIDLNLVAHDSLLVVNGILDKDSISSVYVTHSKGAFSDDKIESIKDASIVLYENGIELGPMLCDLNPQRIQQTNAIGVGRSHYIDSIYFYRYNSTPNPSSIYSIEVSHPDYKNVSATTNIPYDVELLNYEMFLDTTVSNLPFTGYYNTTFNLRFRDNPLEKNYYRIVLYNYWGDYNVTSEHYGWEVFQYGGFHALRLYSNDPSLENTNPDLFSPFYTFSSHHAMFNDDLFNGQEKELSFHVEYSLDQIFSMDNIYIKFIVYNEEGYHYFNSVANNDNKIKTPFGSEPTPIYSNINNGIGVFAGSNTIMQKIEPIYD